MPSCNWGAGWRVCHFVLISSRAIQPETTPWRPCLTQHPGCNYTRTHTHTLAVPNLSKFILCQTDTRTSVGVCFQRRCDLNCLSPKLSLIVLAVLLNGNVGGWAVLKGRWGENGGNRKWASERACCQLQLSPPTRTHTDRDTGCRPSHLSLNAFRCLKVLVKVII